MIESHYYNGRSNSRKFIGTVLDFQDDLDGLRLTRGEVSIGDVLTDQAPVEFAQALVTLVRRSASYAPTYLGYLEAPRLADALQIPGIDDPWMAMRSFCGRKIGEDLIAAHHLFEILTCVFEPEVLGLRISRRAATQEPRLVFDDDDLLTGPWDELAVRKEGILFGSDWLLIDRMVPGGYMNGGFLDHLLQAKENLSVEPLRFGLAIEPDVVLHRRHFRTIGTRAFIRGPRGLSEQTLNSRAFPEDSSGTVTVHMRVGEDPLYVLFPLDRTEVMWSMRGQTKTVQIEELLPAESARHGYITNRYIHARWSTKTSSFIHFDGAIRAYRSDRYASRLATDMKNYKDKADCYHKVFRLDTNLNLETWCDLTTRFFHSNELVLEYFGGEGSN